jgi:hypothetical protein
MGEPGDSTGSWHGAGQCNDKPAVACRIESAVPLAPRRAALVDCAHAALALGVLDPARRIAPTPTNPLRRRSTGNIQCCACVDSGTVGFVESCGGSAGGADAKNEDAAGRQSCTMRARVLTPSLTALDP